MEHSNKELDPGDSPIRGIAERIRRWTKRNRRTVRDQMVRGASYSLGSCAVTVIVYWIQHRL